MKAPSLAIQAVLAAAVAGVLIGSGIVATRFVIAQTDPAALAFMRHATGLVIAHRE